MPFRPPPIPLGQMDSRQQATYFAQQGILAEQKIRTFAPAWDGFSADPVGDMNYMNFGPVIMMWADSGLTGTSDTTNLGFSNIPDQIVPSAQRNLPIIVMDNGVETIGRLIVDTDGTAFVQKAAVSGANITFSTTGFTAANAKGLVTGFLILYAK